MLAARSQDLQDFNTFGLKAQAPTYVRFTDHDQLSALTHLVARSGRSFVLGGGSNVVLAPQVQALIIHAVTRGVQLIRETPEGYLVQAEAGENWHDFVRYCLDQGWLGLENLALIPGTVGAAPVQNIGAYGVELDQFLQSVQAWDLQCGKMHWFDRSECGFSYRDSIFKREPAGKWLIVSVRFFFPRRWTPVLNYPDLVRHEALGHAGKHISAQQIFTAVCEIRRRKLPDPAVLGNAGSFFKNPVVGEARHEELKYRNAGLVSYALPDGQFKLAAGWLIDRAGWKGRRIRDAGVHGRQALVLVNYGAATALEVLYLANKIRQDIRKRFGVELEQEPVNVD